MTNNLQNCERGASHCVCENFWKSCYRYNCGLVIRVKGRDIFECSRKAAEIHARRHVASAMPGSEQ